MFQAACSCIVPGLPGDSLCQIRIRAVGAGGSGHSPWSNATSVRTPPVEAPEPSTSSKSSTGDLDLPSSAMKKGARRAKQRKGRASAGGLPTQDAGRSSKAKILKNVTARPPPKKERLLSKKTVSWVVKVSLCVLFVGAMVFVIMLSAKTDWGPAPGRYAMHYANREMEARRHQYMADMYPYRQEVLDNLSPENQAKLAALQVRCRVVKRHSALLGVVDLPEVLA